MTKKKDRKNTKKKSGGGVGGGTGSSSTISKSKPSSSSSSNTKQSKSAFLKTLRKQYERLNKTSCDLPTCGDKDLLTSMADSTTKSVDVTSWLLTESNTNNTTSSSAKKNGGTDLGVDTTIEDAPKKKSDPDDSNENDENVQNGTLSKSTETRKSEPNHSQLQRSSSSSSAEQKQQEQQQQQDKQPQLTLHSWSSSELMAQRQQSQNVNESLFEQIVKLFIMNMSQTYERSSWGLDIPSKRDELSHRRARYIVLLADTDNENDGGNNNNNDGGNNETNTTTATTTATTDGTEHQKQQKEPMTVAGYCHYRWEYDDEEDPTQVVLYVYELQIHPIYHRRGLGKHLMDVIELIMKQQLLLQNSSTTKESSTTTSPPINKIMFTVFKSNTSAMNFYRNKLQYQIDESSPSQFGSFSEDYEILSKVIS